MFVPRSPRKPVAFHAEYDDGARFLDGVVRDMSTTGLFIECEDTLPPGTTLTVIPLVDSQLGAVRVQAEVVRSAGPGRDGIAVRFVNVDAWTREQVRALLRPEGAPASALVPAPHRVPAAEPVGPVLLLTRLEADAVAPPRLLAVPQPVAAPVAELAATPAAVTLTQPHLVAHAMGASSGAAPPSLAGPMAVAQVAPVMSAARPAAPQPSRAQPAAVQPAAASSMSRVLTSPSILLAPPVRTMPAPSASPPPIIEDEVVEELEAQLTALARVTAAQDEEIARLCREMEALRARLNTAKLLEEELQDAHRRLGAIEELARCA